MNSSHPLARDSNLPNFFRALLFLQHGFLAREDPKFPNSGIRREAPRSGQFLDFFLLPISLFLMEFLPYFVKTQNSLGISRSGSLGAIPEFLKCPKKGDF